MHTFDLLVSFPSFHHVLSTVACMLFCWQELRYQQWLCNVQSFGNQGKQAASEALFVYTCE